MGLPSGALGLEPWGRRRERLKLAGEAWRELSFLSVRPAGDQDSMGVDT